MTVSLNSTHEFVGNLSVIALTKDGGFSILLNNPGVCAQDDMIAIFDDTAGGTVAYPADCPPHGTFQPEVSFASQFVGLDAQGVWYLVLQSDSTELDPAFLDAWQMDFQCNCPTPAPTPEPPTPQPPTPAPTEPCAGTVQASLANTPDFIEDAVSVNSPTVTEFVMLITEPCIITGMTVTLEIDHTWVGDLRTIRVVKGSFPRTLVNTDTGGSCNTRNDSIPNMLVVFDDSSANGVVNYTEHCPPIGTFEPVQALNAYTSENALGTWRLLITDHVPLDNGSLIDWTLDFTCSCSPIPAPTPPPTPKPPTPAPTPQPPTPAPTEPCAENVQASLESTPRYINGLSNTPSTNAYLMEINEDCIINSMLLTLQIDHSFIGNLRNISVSRGQATARLVNTNTGATCDSALDTIPDMNVIFDDTSANGVIAYNANDPTCSISGVYQPVDPLSVFNSLNANGIWALGITDVVNNDDGFLLEWSMQFTCDCSPSPAAAVPALNSLTCPSDVNPVYIDCNIGTGTTNGETLDCIDNPSVGYSTCGSSLVSCDNNCMNVCVGRSTTKGGTVVQKCIDPNEQTVVEPVPMAIEYADYAHTLCTVLNQCGFADQAVCINEAPSNCVDLNCCSVYNQ